MSAGIKVDDDSIWLTSSEYTVSTDTYANTVQVKGKIINPGFSFNLLLSTLYRTLS